MLELFSLNATCQFEAGFAVPLVTVTVYRMMLPTVLPLPEAVTVAVMPVAVTAALDWPTSSEDSSDEDVGATHAASTAAAAKTIVD
jgi:hypothetical protein